METADSLISQSWNVYAPNRTVDDHCSKHWIEPFQPGLLGDRFFEVSLDDPELRGVLFRLFHRAQDQRGGSGVSR